jgi:hypothetical protein
MAWHDKTGMAQDFDDGRDSLIQRQSTARSARRNKIKPRSSPELEITWALSLPLFCLVVNENNIHQDWCFCDVVGDIRFS